MGERIKPGNVYSVYCVMLEGCDKIYVGRTYKTESRFKTHIYNCTKAKNDYTQTGKIAWTHVCGNCRMYEEFAKMNLTRDDIHFYIVKENMTFEEADALETELIAKYKTYNEKYGWNMQKRPPDKQYVVSYGLPPVGGIQ